MNIALFSPYLSQNYGTVLQAFALSKKIRDFGVSCEYIDWCYYDLSFTGRLRFLLRHPLYPYYDWRRKRRNRYDLKYGFLNDSDYREVIRKNTLFVEQFTPIYKGKVRIDDFNRLPHDKFIVGSDQTWTPDGLYQYSPYYLQSIKDSGKKYSYASSMGRNEIPVAFQSFLKKNLSQFNKLSCREEPNCSLLSQLLKKEVSCVVDPTLLLNHDDWKAYMTPVKMPEKYILCYALGEKPCIRDYAEEMGQKKGLPVYYIVTRPLDVPKERQLTGIGVQEFLWLIDNTELLVTDSFHGTIFAINFGKNMASFDKHPGKMYDNGRIQNVLVSYGIENHHMKDDAHSEPGEINYETVHTILEDKRSFSANYLNNIIKEDESVAKGIG